MPDRISFRKELEELINKHSLESLSDTPDFLLANYLMGCLNTFNTIVHAREVWYGRKSQEGPAPENPSEDPQIRKPPI